MFVQRMGKGDQATMVSTVGSYGNHAHTNGIAMELYANNYVLAPDMVGVEVTGALILRNIMQRCRLIIPWWWMVNLIIAICVASSL